jgi:hypothetical protein
VNESERYLRELRRGLPLLRRRRILAEIRHHLEAAIADEQARGLIAADTQRRVVERLGPATVMAERFTADVRSGARDSSSRIVATATRARIVALVAFAAASTTVGVAFLSGAAPARALIVKVDFRSDATHAQEHAVARKLAENPLVSRFVFLSKSVALARMKNREPELVQALPRNPLPDSFEVTGDGSRIDLLIRQRIEGDRADGGARLTVVS